MFKKPSQGIWLNLNEIALLASAIGVYEGAMNGEEDKIAALKGTEPELDWIKRLYEMRTVYNYPFLINSIRNRMTYHLERNTNPRNKEVNNPAYAFGPEDELYVCFICLRTIVIGLMSEYKAKKSFPVYNRLQNAMGLAEKFQIMLKTVYGANV
ncbi:MAG: hypothetical protein J0I20_22445 [Chloroflexi bacterium]|nr:hypothetical protein [Chloroflexota bacterium]OJV99136.1 MAG: hypothetical protein BGO39_16915 [Chloroflexi bacterium 54-19]